MVAIESTTGEVVGDTLDAAMIERLSAKFDDGLIGHKDQFAYISHGLVTERLNKVCPGWSMEVKQVHTFVADGAIHCAGVTVAMTVAGVTRTEMGGPAVRTKNRVPYLEPFALEAKNAMSDAMKRCAMRFGVSLYLWEKMVDARYDDDVHPDREAEGVPAATSEPQRAPQARSGQSPTPAAPAAPQRPSRGIGTNPAAVQRGIERERAQQQAAPDPRIPEKYPRLEGKWTMASVVQWMQDARFVGVTDFGSAIKVAKEWGKTQFGIEDIVKHESPPKEGKEQYGNGTYPSAVVEAVNYWLDFMESDDGGAAAATEDGFDDVPFD